MGLEKFEDGFRRGGPGVWGRYKKGQQSLYKNTLPKKRPNVGQKGSFF